MNSISAMSAASVASPAAAQKAPVPSKASWLEVNDADTAIACAHSTPALYYSGSDEKILADECEQANLEKAASAAFPARPQAPRADSRALNWFLLATTTAGVAGGLSNIVRPGRLTDHLSTPQKFDYCEQFKNFSWVVPNFDSTLANLSFNNVPEDLAFSCVKLFGSDQLVAGPRPYVETQPRVSLSAAGPFPLANYPTRNPACATSVDCSERDLYLRVVPTSGKDAQEFESQNIKPVDGPSWPMRFSWATELFCVLAIPYSCWAVWHYGSELQEG